MSTTLTIGEVLHVARRYMRSVSIERDLGDPDALDGYVVTPSVQHVLARLAKGLRLSSSQRAWRITGPYGTGKSALGLCIAHIVARTKLAKVAMEQLERLSPETSADWKALPRLLPVIVTGTRDVFGRVLAISMQRALRDVMEGPRKPSICTDVDLFIQRFDIGKATESDAIPLLGRFADYVATQKYKGVLLIVDEMGKFLEYATLHPDRADVHTVQLLAELASGMSHAPVAVLGLLHQGFSEYASQYGRSKEEEWGKVAERFEEVTFEESLDQYAFLLSSAMRYEGNALHKAGIDSYAQNLYSVALSEGRLPVNSRAKLIKAAAGSLYPLHPSVLAALAFGTKRFGQNERSLFGFITSEEPGGLRDFVARTKLDSANWFRLSDLYDYFAQGSMLRFRQQDRARKWELLHETLTIRGDLSDDETRILKAIGLINVLGPIPGAESSAQGVAFALVDRDRDENIDTKLSALVRKGVLFKRANGEFTLWQRGSIDLSGVYEEAVKRTQSDDGVASLLAYLPPARPIVAHRHYHISGTLRAFRVSYSTVEQAEHLDSYKTSSEFDGEIAVVIASPTEKAVSIAKVLAKNPGFQDSRRLACVRNIGESELSTFQELRRWRWIEANCEELRVDDFARAEVHKRIESIAQELRRCLEGIVRGASGGPGTFWLHKGEKQEIPSGNALSKKVSSICDEVYPAAPIIRNELINRHKLSSAIAAARIRLVDRMFTETNKSELSITGFPPEKAIYLSLLRASGIHHSAGGKSRFQRPVADDPLHWLPAWDGLRNYLTRSGNIAFDQVFLFLSEPPYGIRQGSALIFVLAFMLANRKDVGLFERGTFQVDLSSDHIQRLLKGPQHFSLHFFPVQEEGVPLLVAYAKELSVIRGKVPNIGDFNSTAAEIYRWFGSLPQYTQQTSNVSEVAVRLRTTLKKASDPLELLFKSLPEACGFESIVTANGKVQSEYVRVLSVAVTELDQAESALRVRIAQILCVAFEFEGSVQELRDYLKGRCGAFADELADYRLKAFIQRAADDALSAEKWIDGMASLLTQKTISQWDDSTVDAFAAEAKARAGQLERWMSLLLDRVTHTESLRDMLGLFVTDTSGMEKRILVDRQSGRGDKIVKLRSLVLKLANDKPVEAARLLAQLLAELLDMTKDDQKAGNDGKTSTTHP